MSRLQILGSLVFVIMLVAFATSTIPDSTSSLEAQVLCATAWACPDITGTPDANVDSSLKVYHRRQSADVGMIETREDWQITAKYRSTDASEICGCDEELYVQTDAGYVTESSGYSYTDPVGGFSAPFNSIGPICSSNATCPQEPEDPYPFYVLPVNLDSSITKECPGEGYVTYYLEQVLYTTTAVANGQICGTLTSKAPVSQIFQAGDNGAFECDNGCAPGPSLTIYYE